MSRRREEALKAEVAVSAAKLEDRGAELAKAQVTTNHPRHTFCCFAATEIEPCLRLAPHFASRVSPEIQSVAALRYKTSPTLGATLHHMRVARDRDQSRADDLAEARAADAESSEDRAAREAMVRRLDNERQYLKSQLQSEITCKDELREALATATRQLGDIKVRGVREFVSRLSMKLRPAWCLDLRGGITAFLGSEMRNSETFQPDDALCEKSEELFYRTALASRFSGEDGGPKRRRLERTCWCPRGRS